jgi:hypothetical protein
MQILDVIAHGGGGLRSSMASEFAKQKVNFSAEENRETRKIKPHVQADSSA